MDLYSKKSHLALRRERALVRRRVIMYCKLRSARDRRDGRVAEGARLESVYTGNRIVGSNPTPSASLAIPNFLSPDWTLR